MKEPKTRADFARWLQETIAFLDSLIRHGVPDRTPANGQFFQEVVVGETMQELARLAARFGYEVEELPTDPTKALVVVGRLLEQVKPRPDLLTVKQAAERLNVSIRTVYDLCDNGRLRCQRIGVGRGTIRIRPADLAGCLAEPAPTTYQHLTI
jgi:excisionase family DNA binding protein